MNRVLSIIALLMLTIGAWAEQTVDIKVLPNANAGTVTYNISEGVCTLTVTPAEGYYLFKGNLKAVKTLSGNALQAPKRSLPIDEGILEIKADANDATKYTFNMPDDSFNVEVTAEFTAGVTFDAATNTLTLNNANITPESGEWAFQFEEDVKVLTVNLIGENTIRGNAFKFANSNPTLSFITDMINPGSLLIGPFTEAAAPYSLISPAEGENGAKVYYENILSIENTDESIIISGKQNVLKIGGVEVTSQNMNDILGDGTVSFVPANAATKSPATLTLKGATIDMSEKDGYAIESNVEALTVCLVGENTITVNANSANAFHYPNTANAGTLTFTHEQNGFGSLTVNGGTLAEGYTVAYDTNEEGWMKTDNSIGFEEVYSVQIGSTKFTASKLTIDGTTGSATFSPITGTLSLNNFTTTDAITTTMEKLTIVLTGVNSVGAITNSGEGDKDQITIERYAMTEAVFNKLLATSISGFETVTVVDPLKMTTTQGVVISDVESYNLWVNGTQVTKENMSTIVTDINFDGDHTLTLTNANIDASENEGAFITNGLSKLTIVLVGDNTVNCGAQSFLTKKEDDNDHQVTFAHNDKNAAGKLTITVSDPENWCTGHSVTYKSDLTKTDIEGGVTIAIPQVTEYGLSIAGIAVTNENAEDVKGSGITGTVKYDAIAKTLTLNGTVITGDIENNMADELKIELNGENTVTGFDRTVDTQGKIKFALGGKTGKLTLTNAFPAEKFDVTTKDRLSFDETNKVLALPTLYGIFVAGTGITSTNRLHVLGEKDESVIFDNNARLILDNATLSSGIVVNDVSSLPNNTLTIYLKGENLIYSSPAIKCNNGTLNLVFEFDNQTESKLEILSNGQVNQNNAFSGVTLSTNDLRFSTSINMLKIEPSLQPIVDIQNLLATVDFSKLPALTDLNGTVLDKVQYNLGSEAENKETSSGIDQTTGKLVFGQSDAMTGTQLEEAKEDDNKFKGVNMMLPSGEIGLELQGVDLSEGFDMGISVGDQEPMSFRELLGPTDQSAVDAPLTNQDLELTLLSAQPQRMHIWVFPVAERLHAPQMANRRIGPKSSVAGGLGGITVKSNGMQASQSAADTYKSMETSAIANALEAVTDVQNGYSCNDPDITDLPDNMFVKNNTSGAPLRRGAAVETILPEGLTFVDFSNTKITGMEVSRTSGAFNGVPENVFIYMPAGNTTKDKNVVIGGICDKLELNGGVDAKPFKAMKNFTASQAVLNRTFEAGGANSKATIYLPYAIPQEDANTLGTFYEFTGINAQNEVQMNKVTTGGLKANKPYIFEAKAGGVANPLVRVVSVAALPAGTEGFTGVYERKDYEPGMYCYAAQARDGKNAVGEFVEMGPGSYVPPFRAYITGNGTPSYAIAWDGVVDDIQNEENTTAVETVKAVAEKKVAEGWWTLNGQRLNAQPKKAGLYIKDGKMVVVK